jgi:hypothetical protein
MIEALQWLGILIVAAFRERRDLALENLALRQQLGVLKGRKRVPRLRPKDRVLHGRTWSSAVVGVIINVASVSGMIAQETPRRLGTPQRKLASSP